MDADIIDLFLGDAVVYIWLAKGKATRSYAGIRKMEDRMFSNSQ